MSTEQKPLVYVIGTGGSISLQGSGRLDFTEYGHAGNHLTIQQMMDRIPEASGFARLNVEQFINVGSNKVELEHWLGLARRINDIFRTDARAAGVAIAHGTATLEETAYFLNLTVRSPKPVVVTGAMRPPTAMGTDADVNLLDAIKVAAYPGSAGMGVLTVLNNEINAARHVTKTNTYRVETFSSGDMGFLGYADSDHQVVFYQRATRRHTHESEFRVEEISQLPRVDIAYATAAGDGLPIRALMEGGASGIVSAGVGSGGAHPDFAKALEEARARGIVVVASSNAGTGRVVRTQSVAENGFVAADNLSPKKSRILLMLALTRTRDMGRIQEMFYTY
jgi:L-asparaginase